MAHLRESWSLRALLTALWVLGLLLGIGCGAPGDALPTLGQSNGEPPSAIGGNGEPIPPPTNPVVCPSRPTSLPEALAPPYATSPVHDTPGSFAVTDDGIATYTMPIFTPPGRAGMQPTLSLKYASNQGQGAIGMGFSIGGLSSIARCPRNLADDGEMAPAVIEGAGDPAPLCLDGLRLKKVGQNGSLHEFRTYPDTFSKVTAVITSTGPQVFIVYTRDGLINVYGGTTESRTPTATNQFAGWALTETRDRFGNTVTYEYEQPQLPDAGGVRVFGEQLLRRVRYTGHTSGTPAPLFEIGFEYIDDGLQSGRIHFRHGVESLRGKLLRSIAVQRGPTLLRRYSLEYAHDGSSKRPKVRTIRECGSDNVCGRPTSFSWSVGAAGWDLTNTDLEPLSLAEWMLPFIDGGSGGSQKLFAGTEVLDFDGDGRSDVSSWRWVLDKGKTTGAFAYQFVNLEAFPGDNYVSHTALKLTSAPVPAIARMVPMEYDDRAGSDLLMLIRKQDPYQLLHFDHQTGSLAYNGTPTGSIAENRFQTFADLNGDGLADLIDCFEDEGKNANYWYKIRTGAIFGGAFPIEVLSSERGCGDLTLLPFDADGDGDADILALDAVPGKWPPPPKSAAHGLLLSLGPTGLTSRSSGLLPDLASGRRAGLLDVNGDGLIDVIYEVGEDVHPSGIYLALNTGRAFAAPIGTNLPADVLQHHVVLDANGDGRDDLLAHTGSAYASFHVFSPSSDGMSWAETVTDFQFYANPPGGLEGGGNYLDPQVGDFNGDGQPDLLYKRAFVEKNAGIHVVAYVGYHKRTVSTDPTTGFGPADVIVGVRDGATPLTSDLPTVKIIYGTLTDRSHWTTVPQIYDRPTQCPAEARCTVGPQWVVDTETVATRATAPGADGTRRTFHHYSDGRVDRLRGTWLGFRTHELRDSFTGEKVTRSFDNFTYDPVMRRFPRAGLLYEESRQFGGEVFKRHNAWAARTTANGASYFHYITNVHQTDFEGGEAVGSRHTETKRVIDDYGNETHAETRRWFGGDPPNAAEDTVVDRTFANDTGDLWLIGRLLTQVASDSGMSRELVYIYENPITGTPTRIELDPTDALGVTLWRTRDTFGNVIHESLEAKSGEMRETCVAYDLAGYYPVSSANALGHVTTEVYGLGGELLAVADPNGRAVRVAYDGFLRPLLTLYPDNTFSLWQIGAYGKDGSVVQTGYTSGGEITSVISDPAGRPRIRLRTGFGGAVVWDGLAEYDDDSRVRAIGQPGAAPSDILYTRFTYDARGRLKSSIDPDGAVTTHSYGPTLYGTYDTISKDPKQVVTRVRRDARGRVVESVDGHGKATKYGYVGFATSVTDPKGNSITTVRDPRGRVISVDDPDIGHRKYEHNAFGELVYERDAKGDETFLQYDKLSRLRRRKDADGVHLWNYDPTGNIGAISTSRSADGHRLDYDYDALGRPTATKTRIDGEVFTTRTLYDALSRVARVEYPEVPGFGAYAVEYGRDAYGHVWSAESVSGPAQERSLLWSKQAETWRGQTTDESFGNGTRTLRQFDAATGQLRLLLTHRGRDPIQALAYRYDARGDLAARRDYLQAGIEERFTYDELRRVTSATFSTASTPHAEYAYDELGNLRTKTDVGTLSYDAVQPHAVSSVGGMAYQYDPNGNLRFRGLETFSYTALGKVKAHSFGRDVTTYEYDAEGQRVKRVTPTETTIYANVYERRTTAAGVEHTYYVASADRGIAVVATAGTTRRTLFLHADRNGSMDVVTDETGAVRDRQSFDPFGARRNPKWTSSAPPVQPNQWVHLGFTAHEDDPSGIVNTGARLYDPKIGRFLQPDTMVDDGLRGQAFNRYSYVQNNAVSWIDPSGHSAVNADDGKPAPAPPQAPIDGPGIPQANQGQGPDPSLGGGSTTRRAPPGGAREAPAAPPALVDESVAGTDVGMVGGGVLPPSLTMAPADIEGLQQRAQIAGGLDAAIGQVNDVFLNAQRMFTAPFLTPFGAWWLSNRYHVAIPTIGIPATGSAEEQNVARESYNKANTIGQVVGMAASMAVGMAASAGTKAKTIHHIATNKSPISTNNGGPWTPKFKPFFDKAGITMEDAANKIAVRGHAGPHPQEYHEHVYRRLWEATEGLKGTAYKDALRAELIALGKECARRGSYLNKLITRLPVEYYDLLEDIAGTPGRLHLGEVTAEGEAVSHLLTRGVAYAGPLPLKSEVSTDGFALPFSLTAFGVPVVSTALAHAFRSVAGRETEFFELHVRDRDPLLVMNAINVVDCVDEKRSAEVRRWRPEDGRPDRLGRYRSVAGMRLRAGAIPEGISVFRVKGWTVALVVSDDMRREMLRVGCHGAKFVQVT